VTNENTQAIPDCDFLGCDAIQACGQAARKVVKKSYEKGEMMEFSHCQYD
jgi:hypothetical protein